MTPQPVQTATYALDRKATEAKLRPDRFRDNLKLAQEFRAKYPNDGFSNHLLAQAMAESGLRTEAIQFAVLAAKYSILDPMIVSHLAGLYLEFGLYEFLGPLLIQAFAKSPGSAILASDLGDYYAAIANVDMAVEHFQRALELTTNEHFRNGIKRSLVDVLRNANRLAEVELILEELKSFPDARVFVLTRLAQIGKQNADSAVGAEIQALLEDNKAKLNNGEKALLHLALGGLYENKKDFDAAFTHWARSRALDGALYVPEAAEKIFNQIEGLYGAELFAATRTFANHSQAPIFVIGMPRSGTTLMEQIISAHPKAMGVGELVRMGRRNTGFVEAYGKPGGLEALRQNALKGEISARAAEFLKLAELVAGRKADRIVDKTPTQFLAAGYIHMCFPNARFIHCMRHPADTFISTYQNNFSKEFGFAFDQTAFAHYYLQRETLMAHWRSLFGDKILDVKYEELVSNPEETVKNILNFIGLDWDPACLKFFERTTTVRTFSKDQVRSEINTRSVARWRNYEKHLSLLFAELGKANFTYNFE